ncbi:hypothetical protein [Chromohalobacter sp. 296-RDG]|uniref:hypothetical protein n=1 Tax=Chromohalobacter sp. 296-RDG TaxID=2994062 RepID=UPI00246928C4|nr:hypothetical protein [Chromohalobacter sp. 296-RDG]
MAPVKFRLVQAQQALERLDEHLIVAIAGHTTRQVAKAPILPAIAFVTQSQTQQRPKLLAALAQRMSGGDQIRPRARTQWRSVVKLSTLPIFVSAPKSISGFHIW